jgi:galactonate dehydratase
MTKIQSIEYFRVRPRWLFVKVCDADGNSGWGEATLEGHTEAVEGTLNALAKRFIGYEAEYVHGAVVLLAHAAEGGEWWLTSMAAILSICGRPPGG